MEAKKSPSLSGCDVAQNIDGKQRRLCSSAVLRVSGYIGSLLVHVT